MDNDPKHTAIVSKHWFEMHKIEVMKWPAQSPDLNPIETLWNDVDRVIKESKPTNMDELWGVVCNSWRTSPKSVEVVL